MTGKKIRIFLICFFLLLTAGAYTYGVVYFSKHFLPGSVVNGLNCSYMTIGEAQDLLQQKIAAYVLTLETKNNGRECITSEEAGLSYIPDGTMRAITLNQDRFTWFLAFGQQKSYEQISCVSYDREHLLDVIDDLRCMQPDQIVPSQDARIIEYRGGFRIESEVIGNEPDREKLCDVIANAFEKGITTINLEEEGCYFVPSVYQEDPVLIRNCAQVNRLTDVIITYDFANEKEVVDRSVIVNWLVRDAQGDMVLDREKVAEFVYQLGAKYDTVGLEREFHTCEGDYVTVQGGDYGWVIDQDAETEALMEAIRSGQTDVREPVYSCTGLSRDSRNDIGMTYLEIDLSNQRLVFYQEGRPIVDTPVVTGDPYQIGTATPTGCYYVKDMLSPAVLKGADYEQNVDYWLPFSEGLGLHDAGWRSSFGGQVYLDSGSEGNIQIPYNQARVIYQNMQVGVPVVIYERDYGIFD